MKSPQDKECTVNWTARFVLIALLSNILPAIAADRKWTIALDGGCAAGSISASAPVISDGRIYVGSGDGAVYSLDAATGAQKWRFQTGIGLPSGPEILVSPPGSDAAQMAGIALDEKAKRGPRGKRQITATPVVDGDSVYIGSWDHNFYALDAMTGKPRWSFDAHLPLMDGAVLDAGKVIFATGGTQVRYDKGDALVYALDASSGSKAWVFDTLPDLDPKAKFPSHPPVVRDGVAYIINWNAAPFVKGAADTARIYLHAVETASGEVRWSSRMDGAWPSPPAITQKYVLFTTTPRGVMNKVELHALDRSTGHEAWRYETDGGKDYWQSMSGANQSRPPAVLGENMVALATDLSVIGLDIDTGDERWRLTEPFKKESIVEFDFGAGLYVGTGDTMTNTAGHLYGIDALTGLPTWSMSASGGADIRGVIDGVVYVEMMFLRRSIRAIDGADGRQLGTVWPPGLIRGGSYGICSGPVRHGDRLLISTERQLFAGQPDSPGRLYSVAVPKRKSPEQR